MAAGSRIGPSAAIVAVVVLARLQRDRALADLGDEPVRVQPFAHPVEPTESLEGGRGRDDRVHAVASGAGEPVRHVAAKSDDAKVRSSLQQQRPSPWRARRDGGARSQSGERPSDEDVGGVARRGTPDEREPVGRRARQVFGAVHRDVGVAVEHGALDLDGEDAFATDHRERRRPGCGRPRVSTGTRRDVDAVGRQDAVARSSPGPAPAAIDASPGAVRS